MKPHSGIAWCSMIAALASVLAASAAAQEARRPPGELAEQVAMARTADDHADIAAALSAKASQYEAAAGEHRRLAAAYATSGIFLRQQSLLGLAEHCTRAAENLAAAAAEVNEIVREHQAVAQRLRAEPKAAR